MSQQADVERVALSMREAAQAIGVSERTIWNAIRNGKLKASKLGRLVRIRPTDLERFVAGNESEVRHD
jgi:excisionase family DNA binding protein